MPSMKAIKRRRLTVKNISQITKAMNLVATSKLQRARNNLRAVAKPVQATFDFVYSTFSDEQLDMSELPFVNPREDVKKSAYILITSNRGLCGGYNNNACKELVRHARENNKTPVIIPLGRRGLSYFRRRGGDIIEIGNVKETPEFRDAKDLTHKLLGMYEAGEIDEVYVVYTKYITALSLEPIVRKVLPIDPSYLRRIVGSSLREGEKWEDLGFFKEPSKKEVSSINTEVEYDPGINTVLSSLVPWYLSMFIYAAMASSALCEQSAVMVSMDAATKNAGEIIEKLTLMYNRQRQSAITQEITEIVSGASALK